MRVCEGFFSWCANQDTSGTHSSSTLERLWALVESTETSGELVVSLGIERMRSVSFSSKCMAVGIRPRIMHY
jgi:hypothetical protein